MMAIKQLLKTIFPLPSPIQELIQTETFLLISPKIYLSSDLNKTIIKCLEYQSMQQAQLSQINFLSASNCFHLRIISSKIKQYTEKKNWVLILQIQAVQYSLRQKLNMNRKALIYFEQNQLIQIINSMNILYAKYFSKINQYLITSNQLIDNIFVTFNQIIKLTAYNLLAPIKNVIFDQNTTRQKDKQNIESFNFSSFLIEILTLGDKRQLYKIDFILSKLKAYQFQSFSMKIFQDYLICKLTQNIHSSKIDSINQIQIKNSGENKLSYQKSLKSASTKRPVGNVFTSPNQKNVSTSNKRRLEKFSPQTSFSKLNKRFQSLNEMADDKIVESFQDDEYSYILQSDITPNRMIPHKGFSTNVSRFAQQVSPSRFSVYQSEKITEEPENSQILEAQSHSLKQSLQNSKAEGLQSSNFNSIILQVEQEQNNELIEMSSIKSEIIDLSFSQNNEEYNQIKQIKDIHNGTKYFGQVVNGLKQGKGKMIYCDGGYYEGQWKNNKICGFGRLYYPSNKLAYAGYWKNGCFNGPGLVLNQEIQPVQQFNLTDLSCLGRCWISYRGDFNMDIREGFGIVKISNGDSISGVWQGNCLNGEAEYQRKDGTLTRGIWNMNKLQKILNDQPSS